MNSHTHSSVQQVNNNSQVVINELIIINNDRYEGYINAAREVKDNDLKVLFTQLGIQSLKCNAELKRLLPFSNSMPTVEISDDLFRACIFIKAWVHINDRKGVLTACENGESMTVGYYKRALEREMPDEVRLTLIRQKSDLYEVQNSLRNLAQIS